MQNKTGLRFATSKTGLLLLLLAVTASGCGVLLPSSDTFVMIGNEEAIRAYHDSINGLVTNAKTSDPVGNSAYWDARHGQEKQRAVRSGFWQKLTASPSQLTGGNS